MKKALFIDRDGTLVIEPPGTEQVDSLEILEFYPGVFRNLFNIRHNLDYELIIVSNQDGMGTPSFPYENFIKPQQKILQAFENEGITFDNIHIDTSRPQDHSPDRKPGTGMLKQYMNGEIDLKRSFVIGDRITDVQLAKNLGCSAILLGAADRIEEVKRFGLEESCALITGKWEEIWSYLLKIQRFAVVERSTRETRVRIELSLDGDGKTEIQTGLGFFDHMLEQIGKHSGCDLKISVKGDLHVDEHHTVEDTALALGEAFLSALGDKRGIFRYGFLLPMDDSLAQVAVDFGGRPWLVWNGEFKREKIGDVPTEMFYHFFKSFSDAAKCNLNIKFEGSNEHHKIEAVFKAFAKAVKMAVSRDPESRDLPSTKGTV